MRKTFGMNKHQKAAHRPGERRVGREQLEELLEMAAGDDPEDRAVAAQYLCPCHVRRRIDAVWQALYRMLEDPDVRVRRRAWHTLEDGGRPDDPALDEIIARTLERESDSQVLRFARMFAGPRRERESVLLSASTRPQPRLRGKCDFCGVTNVQVEMDLATMIPTGDLPRAAWICLACKSAANDRE